MRDHCSRQAMAIVYISSGKKDGSYLLCSMKPFGIQRVKDISQALEDWQVKTLFNDHGTIPDKTAN